MKKNKVSQLNRKEVKLILLMGLISITGGMEFSFFAPSLPEIQRDFGIGESLTHWLITANTIIFAISAFFIGSFEGYFSKRSIVLCGLLVYTLGNCVCYISDHYSTLLFGRIIQGAGAAATGLACTGIVVEIFPIVKQRYIIAMIAGLTSLGFMMAPPLGAYVSIFLPWYDDFLILAVMSFLAFMFTFLYLPEDKDKPAKENFSFICSLLSYREILLNKKIMTYALAGLFPSIAYRVFFLSSPILFLKDLHMSKFSFGNWELTDSLIFIIFSTSSGYIFKKFGTIKAITFSVGIFFIFIVSTLLIVYTKNNLANIIFAMIIIYTIGNTFVNITFTTASYNVIPGTSIKVKAMLRFFKAMSVAITFQFLAFFHGGTFAPIGMVMICLILISFPFIFISLRDSQFINQWKNDS